MGKKLTKMKFPRPLIFMSIMSFGLSLLTGWHVFAVLGALLIILVAYKGRNS